jgi:translation initiation factor 2 subunit 2
MNYEDLLERALKKLPERSESTERLKIPQPQVFISGQRTIIVNFLDICNALRRECNHVQKFLLKELATSGEMQEKRLIVQGRFKQEIVEKKLDLYLKDYVICPECGKPDTKLIKEERFIFMKCEACGARHVVKKI